jgi:hypothetical protein
VPGSLPSQGSRKGRLGDSARRERAHPHVHRHLGPAPEGEAAYDARAVPRSGRRVCPLCPASQRRRGVLGRGCDAQRLSTSCVRSSKP